MSDSDFGGKLCAIDDENLKSSFEEESSVYCSHCGATSNDPSSLCDPVSFGDR